MQETNKNPDDAQVLDTTTVGQAEVNIDELFGLPGAESIMLPADGETEKPKTMFSKESVDTTFLDKSSFSEKKEEDVEVKEAIAELDGLITQAEDAGGKGRPKVDKSGLADLAQKMIEEGSLVGFDDDKPLEEYTTKDFRELFEANFQERENKIKADTPKEFFKALPEELQIAAKYVADGGQDLKGLFKTLSYVEEIYDLDPSVEHDQAEIARQYLWATQFGTAEEIETEIGEWYEMGRLETKANQFKPKLDRMQEEIVARKLAEQEGKKQQQAKQAKMYTDTVYRTLEKGDLGGLKLDKKVQGMLYSGLVQPNYPSISGKPTNMLGHLLEKYQFVEPRHDLIAEALWLLADPNGYKSKVREQGSKEAIEKTVRQLKTEESRKITSSVVNEQDDVRKGTSKQQPNTISRNGGSMFRRF